MSNLKFVRLVKHTTMLKIYFYDDLNRIITYATWRNSINLTNGSLIVSLRPFFIVESERDVILEVDPFYTNEANIQSFVESVIFDI
jgi:hypothetical protein